ncbi:MAG: NAD(P)H-dependent oxidoreductase [Acidaminococcaceae bacterium]|nr:NAD(P)H-dependent oxidoreductase [Acidaminococcaceae bacterium]
MAKILIAYYSRKGQNYWNGSIKNLAKGNTETVAEMIQKTVGGDLFEIETVKEYPIDYTGCTEVAKEELLANARPELKSYPERIDNYDIIFLGYPCWWGTMPMGVYTFLEHFNFAGKKIAPFCTHEGSRMGGSVNHIKKTAPGAVVLEGLPVHGAEVAGSEDAVTDWAKKSLSAEAGEA